MALFDVAINVVLSHEGGYVNNQNDPGGATNFGVSLRYLLSVGDINGDGILEGDFDQDGDVDIVDIKRMSMETAINIYRTQWWNRYRYGVIHQQVIANKVLDMSVNMGAKQAHLCVQRALRACLIPVIEDGVIGDKTFGAINYTNPTELIIGLRSECAGVYRQIVAKNPKSSKFLSGWLRRAYDV